MKKTNWFKRLFSFLYWELEDKRIIRIPYTSYYDGKKICNYNKTYIQFNWYNTLTDKRKKTYTEVGK